ncbi:hypothetical protein C8R47DRAFT_1227722 [Mycena vitilis]|nr:hypothetical protein C8R47DRAFT_1227722 [Mycena vitilis]
MTVYKAQGKTLPACVVNFTGCHGTESAYVMISRATSLEGLVILTPFSKDKICCRQSEDVRKEFRRLRDLRLQTVMRYRLQTVMRYGTAEEAEQAKKEMVTMYGTSAPNADVPDVESADKAGARVDQLQRHNAAIITPAPIGRATRVPIDQPISGLSLPTSSQSSRTAASSRSLRKRKLDEPVTLEDSTPVAGPISKRPRR